MKKVQQLLPPTGYKGGKRKLAGSIADRLIRSQKPMIYDVCGGSGAVTLALIAAGYPVDQITYVEAGPWGLFFKEASYGGLNMGYIRELLLDEMPKDPKLVADWVEKDVALREPGAEEFLILQAASYGSTPVWHDGDRWRRGDRSANRAYKARSYWEPGPTSKEKKPRGTIFRPDKIINAVAEIDVRCRGLEVHWGDAFDADYKADAIIYLDPPYEGDTGYGYGIDVGVFLSQRICPVYLSEGVSKEDADLSDQLGIRRGSALTKGSKRKSEWLNFYDCPKK
jgi:hypothetical protein